MPISKWKFVSFDSGNCQLDDIVSATLEKHVNWRERARAPATAHDIQFLKVRMRVNLFDLVMGPSRRWRVGHAGTHTRPRAKGCCV